jgi:acyl-CoA thioester hydrolase
MNLAPEGSVGTSLIPMRVRFFETDLMGIVHHASYLLYFEMARVEWLRRRGVAYAAWAERGLHLPVVDAQIKYRAPARFDDELLVETTLGEMRAASIRFEYRIRRGEKVLVEGSTRLACVDASHSLKRLTDEMIAVLQSPERTQIG